MAKRSEFVDYLLDELAPLGQLRAKAMFGGFGLYCDELFFALVADDVLFIKVDEINRPRFLAENLAPFCFAMKDGRTQTMSYYPLPDAALESNADMLSWAKEGLAAALRAKQAKK